MQLLRWLILALVVAGLVTLFCAAGYAAIATAERVLSGVARASRRMAGVQGTASGLLLHRGRRGGISAARSAGPSAQ